MENMMNSDTFIKKLQKHVSEEDVVRLLNKHLDNDSTETAFVLDVFQRYPALKIELDALDKIVLALTYLQAQIYQLREAEKFWKSQHEGAVKLCNKFRVRELGYEFGDMIMMPKSLTAENGMMAALIGEPFTWTTIKDIYAAAVTEVQRQKKERENAVA